LRKARLAYRCGRRYLPGQDVLGGPMVALGIIFGFIAIICVLNFIEFKRVD
jgi:hypothetical protein